MTRRQDAYRGYPGSGGRRSRTGGRSRRRDPVWAKLCLTFGLLLALAGGVGAMLPRLVVDRLAGAIHQQNLLLSGSTPHHASVKGPKNILLIGIDERPTAGSADGTRSDTMIILHVNAAHTAAYLVSLPRDTLATIPPGDNGVNRWRQQQAKLNAAFAFGSMGLTDTTKKLAGGAQALQNTIQTDYGISIDAAAIVDFSGFKQVVDALGGVTMCVDEKTISIHYGTTSTGKITGGVGGGPYVINPDGTLGARNPKVQPLVYNVGCQHFDGFHALDYVRQRDLLANHDYDYGRQRHQQQLIKAVFKGLFSAGTLSDPGKLNKVLTAIGSAITFDGGGVSIPDWIFAMSSITPNTVYTIKTNDSQLTGTTVAGLGEVQQLNATSQELLSDVKNDTVEQFVAQHPDWVAVDSSG